MSTSWERLVEEVDKELFGTSYLSIAIPIFEKDVVVGCIEIYQSLERKTKLQEIAECMDISAKELNQAVQQLVTEAKELSISSKQLRTISQGLLKEESG